MRKTPLFIAIGASILLSACGSSGLFNRNRPDEFAVQRQAPLVVPPDFGLVPPSADAPRPAASAQDQAMDALFGGPAPRSNIEKTTLNRAGTPAPGIRSNVGDPGTATVAKGEVTRDILAAPEGDGREAQTVIPG